MADRRLTLALVLGVVVGCEDEAYEPTAFVAEVTADRGEAAAALTQTLLVDLDTTLQSLQEQRRALADQGASEEALAVLDKHAKLLEERMNELEQRQETTP